MSEAPGIATRAVHACAPMLAGAFIDAVDFATFGPIGLSVGWLIGAGVGWWLAPILGFPPRRRTLAAVLTGIYCAMPMTGFLPLATFAAGLARVIEGEPRDLAIARESPPTSDTQSDEVVDAEFESSWEERGSR